MSPPLWLQIHTPLPRWERKQSAFMTVTSNNHPSFCLPHLTSQTNGQCPKDAFISYPFLIWLSPSQLPIFFSALSIMTSFVNSIACFSFYLNPAAFYTPVPKTSLWLFFHHHCTFLIILPLVALPLTLLPLLCQLLSFPKPQLLAFHSLLSMHFLLVN